MLYSTTVTMRTTDIIDINVYLMDGHIAKDNVIQTGNVLDGKQIVKAANKYVFKIPLEHEKVLNNTLTIDKRLFKQATLQ